MAEAIFNGRRVSYQPGETILEAARRAGVEIPTLCHMKDFSTSGQCGVCVVELAGSGHIKQACRTPLEEGMVVATDSPKVREARANALRRLVASGAHNCLVCDIGGDKWQELQMEVMAQPWHDTVCPAWGDCRLQDLIIRYGVSMRGVEPKIRQHPLDDDQPMIVRDFSRCIKCGRCVSACNDVQVNLAIAPPDEAALKAGLLESDWRPVVDYAKCTHCGQCIQACPVGALFEKKAYGQALANELQKVRTTCPYCGVGCQIWLHVKDGRIFKTSAVEDAEPNKGRLCVKGRFGYDFIYSEDRLTTPLIREGEGFREASWDEALDLVASKFKQIIAESGPDALAGVSCARSINEDSYNMQKLFRAVIGTNNIDHCART